MKKTWAGWLAAVAVGVAVGFVTARAADGLAALPEPLARVIAALYPGAELVSVGRERGDGVPEYEIMLRQRGSGHVIEIEAEEGAGVTELDEEIAPHALPEAVRRTLQSSFPSASLQKAVKTAETSYHYEVDLLVEGRRHEVTLSRRGKILEVDRKD
jgi:hypothetical protein